MRLNHRSAGGPIPTAMYTALVMGIAARLYHLGSQSIWGDEAITLANSGLGLSLRDAFLAVWHKGFHAPLYFVVTHIWYALGTSEFMLRIPSALFGVASIPVAHALVRRIYGERAAGIAAFVVALSPFHIWYSQEARMYSLQLFLCLLSMLFYVRIFQEGRPRDITFYALFSALALYTHIATALLLAAQGIFALIASAHHLRRFAAWLGVQAAVVLIFSPWLMNLARLYRLSGSGLQIGFERPKSLWDVGYGLYTFGAGFSLGPSVSALHQSPMMRTVYSHLPVIAMTVAVIGPLFLLGLLNARGTNRWGSIMLFLLMLVPTGLASLAALMPGVPLNPRYMIVAIIPFWIVLALGIDVCLRCRKLRVVPVALAVVTGLALYNHYHNPEYAKQDTRSAARLINRMAGPRDAVVISSIELGGPFIYYFRRQDITYSGYPPVPGHVNARRLPQELGAELRGKQRVWLVYGRTWSSDPEGLIPAYLASIGRVVCHGRYPGVTVACYEIGGRGRVTRVSHAALN